MKRTISIFLALMLFLPCFSQERVSYDDHFTSERLRIDLVLAGNKDVQRAYLSRLHKESKWVGPKGGLIDPFLYGENLFEVYSGGKLIYSKGFSTLFHEWTTTEEASRVDKAYTQSIWMPFPKDKVEVILYRRDKKTGRFEKFFSFSVDPSDKLITQGKENDFVVSELQSAGDPSRKLDILFVAEGYTESQRDKLHSDAHRFMEYMFSMAPYKFHRFDINVRLLESYSQESGVDKPHKDVWVNSVLDSGFYTFYTDRYLTVSDHTRIASVVSGAPFDVLFILVNDDTYGGGGIYNSYAMGTVDSRFAPEVFIHEFGHSFAGLADEYYSSDVAYEDIYDLGVEPWEPNVTSLKDFGKKWKDMMDEGTPIPTPVADEYSSRVGVFEGAGYMSKGLYRPYVNCRMLSNTAEGFCPVCSRAIERMIDYYADRIR